MPVIKWYLNLENAYGDTNKGRAGLAIGLVATRGFGHGSGHGGRAVDWTLAEAGPHDADRDYFPNPATLDANRTAERNGQFHNALNLTLLGGRTFTVTATKATGANNVAFNKQYQSWRRIYYSVHHMNPRCKTLFESVEQQIKDIFAGVFIELKPRGNQACIVNQAVTNAFDPVTGATLTHTYTATAPPLDRSPQHLRVVIVRDVVKGIPLDAKWTMDSTTATPAAKLIRINSQGVNHREVIYSNDLSILDALNPAQTLTVSVHSASIAIPNACIAPNGAHGLRVDLGADPTTIPIRTSLSAGRKVNLTATLTGRRCTAGYAAGNDHAVQATLTLANVESNPVTVGSAKVWVAGLGASIFVEDPQILLATPGAADQLRVTLSNATVVNVAATEITRVNVHKLRLDLSGEAPVLADIAQHPITISVRRHGLLANGPIEAPADHEFDLREFTQNADKTRRKVRIQVDFAGHITVTANWLALAANNPLTMRIETLDVPIAIPLAALTVQTPQTLKIDLNAHPTLQPAAAAMAAGGNLTFDGKLRGLHSIGGYSPAANREFIALTTRKLRDEDDAAIARRLKLSFCHEIGHALGLNFTTVQNHRLGQAEDNGLRYTETYGGQGNHCSYNAQLEPSGAERGRETTSSGEIYVSAGAGPLCIMYHSLDLTHMGDDFCPTCKAYLRRARVRL